MYTCRLQSYVFLHPNRQYIFYPSTFSSHLNHQITSQMAKKSKVSGDIDPHPPSNFVYEFGFDQWVAFCWLAITRGTRWRLDWHDQQNYLSVTVFYFCSTLHLAVMIIGLSCMCDAMTDFDFDDWWSWSFSSYYYEHFWNCSLRRTSHRAAHKKSI